MNISFSFGEAVVLSLWLRLERLMTSFEEGNEKRGETWGKGGRCWSAWPIRFLDCCHSLDDWVKGSASQPFHWRSVILRGDGNSKWISITQLNCEIWGSQFAASCGGVIICGWYFSFLCLLHLGIRLALLLTALVCTVVSIIKPKCHYIHTPFHPIPLSKGLSRRKFPSSSQVLLLPYGWREGTCIFKCFP